MTDEITPYLQVAPLILVALLAVALIRAGRGKRKPRDPSRHDSTTVFPLDFDGPSDSGGGDGGGSD